MYHPENSLKGENSYCRHFGVFVRFMQTFSGCSCEVKSFHSRVWRSGILYSELIRVTAVLLLVLVAQPMSIITFLNVTRKLSSHIIITKKMHLVQCKTHCFQLENKKWEKRVQQFKINTRCIPEVPTTYKLLIKINQ